MNALETHLTLPSMSEDQFERAQTLARSLGLKWTHVELDRGESRSQPMVTFWGKGTLAAQHRRAQELTREFQSIGRDVTRVKVEVALVGDRLPEVFIPAALDSPRYFETHFKLLLSDAEDVVRLGAALSPFSAHISRNARRFRADGRHERFVTQRVSESEAHSAPGRRDELRRLLIDSGWTILEEEAEFVVFDSNLLLDAGWIT